MNDFFSMSDSALDARARRAARAAGYIVRKSRRNNPLENQGGYMLLNAETGTPVAGFDYSFNAVEVAGWLFAFAGHPKDSLPFFLLPASCKGRRVRQIGP